VDFCREIEVFVAESSLQTWWNHGVSEHALQASCFLLENRIAERVASLQSPKWRLAIDDLLGCIPSIDIIKMNSYIRSISSKLTVYEKLKDIATLLELALWKSNSQNLKTKGNLRAKKLQRIMCGADVIIPNVLSFLMVDRWT
jgi:hypothetical protein